MEYIEEKTKKLGVFDYIVKPFEPERLLGCIERALKSTRYNNG